MAFSGLSKEKDEMRRFSVPVGTFEGRKVHMRTIICCKKENQKKEVPKLVFIHGYCGSGALFFKIFERLAEHVCLILVDLPGMGASDHQKDFDKLGFTLD